MWPFSKAPESCPEITYYGFTKREALSLVAEYLRRTRLYEDDSAYSFQDEDYFEHSLTGEAAEACEAIALYCNNWREGNDILGVSSFIHPASQVQPEVLALVAVHARPILEQHWAERMDATNAKERAKQAKLDEICQRNAAVYKSLNRFIRP